LLSAPSVLVGWWAGADSNCHILSEAILQTPTTDSYSKWPARTENATV
jgi:hypothetical protein